MTWEAAAGGGKETEGGEVAAAGGAAVSGGSRRPTGETGGGNRAVAWIAAARGEQRAGGGAAAPRSGGGGRRCWQARWAALAAGQRVPRKPCRSLCLRWTGTPAATWRRQLYRPLTLFSHTPHTPHPPTHELHEAIQGRGRSAATAGAFTAHGSPRWTGCVPRRLHREGRLLSTCSLHAACRHRRDDWQPEVFSSRGISSRQRLGAGWRRRHATAAACGQPAAGSSHLPRRLLQLACPLSPERSGSGRKETRLLRCMWCHFSA